MARKPQPLRFHRFGKGDPLDELSPRKHKSLAYLRCYLTDLEAHSIVEEPYYFDRDYLAEFSAFYSTSARGYDNICRRLHFFRGEVDRESIRIAATGDVDALDSLRSRYLGFTTLRPFDPPLLGRTVLRWYPDPAPSALVCRVTQPSRDYRVHLAGLSLSVEGIAWQQQDVNVGACATVALWSMLHSSALDDHHAIPTTAAITRAAHEHGLRGTRIFPSTGLTIAQIGSAIQKLGLSPIVLKGELARGAFSRARLAKTLATFIRSGYPVLLAGTLWRREEASPRIAEQHALCATGFRAAVSTLPPGTTEHLDAPAAIFYLHDDNLGPNVRFRLTEEVEGGTTFAVLVPERPDLPVGGHPDDPTPAYPKIVPNTLLVAVHDDLRTTTDKLFLIAETITRVVDGFLTAQGLTGLTVATRFIKLREYMGKTLQDLLAATSPDLLARVRLALLEEAPPMSLHLGLVRLCVGLEQVPFVDILYDTTELTPRAFAHVPFEPTAKLVFTKLAKKHDLGVLIDGT